MKKKIKISIELEKRRKEGIGQLCMMNKIPDNMRDEWINRGLSITEVADQILLVLEQRKRKSNAERRKIMKDRGYPYDSNLLEQFKGQCEVLNRILLKAHLEGYKIEIIIQKCNFMQIEESDSFALNVPQIHAEFWLDFLKEAKTES